MQIKELLDLKKSESKFGLLLDKSVNIDENMLLSKQFDFVITKYERLAKKYI